MCPLGVSLHLINYLSRKIKKKSKSDHMFGQIHAAEEQGMLNAQTYELLDRQ